MKIVIASNNQGKLKELQTMFAPLGCELVCQGALGVPEAPADTMDASQRAFGRADQDGAQPWKPGAAHQAGLGGVGGEGGGQKVLHQDVGGAGGGTGGFFLAWAATQRAANACRSFMRLSRSAPLGVTL